MSAQQLSPNDLRIGTASVAPSRNAVWTGRILSALAVAFMLFDGGIKLIPLPVVTQSMAQIGWPATPEMARTLGVIGLLCAALYAFPRTALIGAIVLTGYLGGAIATQLRIGAPLFSHILFGVYLGLMVWGGLALRDSRLRALLAGR
jgi:TRAP-type C4-dicarboxylate transport system permease small subunit